MKLECSQLSFEKYSDTKFHENPSSGSRVVPLVRTKRRTRQIAVLQKRLKETSKPTRWNAVFHISL